MVVRANDKIVGLVIVLLLFSSVMFDRVMTYSIEEDKRAQARYNLEHISYCFHFVKQFKETGEALRICTTGMRTTHTGDVYVLDFNTLEFLFENSTDVPNNKLYFTEESVGKEFNKQGSWETGQRAVELMRLGKDSQQGLNGWYRFDNEVEWLEWKILPRLSIENQDKYIVVQGIQKDEVYERYSLLRYTAFSVIALAVSLLLSSIKVKHRRY